MTTPPLAPDSDTERLLAEADKWAPLNDYFMATLVGPLAAKVRELQAERDKLRHALVRVSSYVANHDHEGRSEEDMDREYPDSAAVVADDRKLIRDVLSAHQHAKEA